MNETAFPTTRGTWLRTQVDGMNAVAGNPALAAAARINAHAYAMERRAQPLAVFVRGSSLSRLGEAEELVNGFFASRLSDAGFLEGWSRSGVVEPRELKARAASDATGEVDFERARALAVVREATARVEDAMRSVS